jgi:UDP-3-O-[3-hydroxymyristoyl] glucosamine N-acyltransferase
LIEEVLGLTPPEAIACDSLGLVAHSEANMLTFIDDELFLEQAASNPNVSAVFISEKLGEKLGSTSMVKIVCDDPRYYFYSLWNYLAKAGYQKIPSIIDPSARIDTKASVAEYNVEIGKNVVIEPNATILPDVVIGDNCIIGAGAVLGCQGYEHKRTSRGILSIFHDGKVILGNDVEIGSNTCVDKGFSYRATKVGDFTKIDNLVHISHCVHIGKNCLIIAGAVISGTVTIMDDVWVGPNAVTTPHITIGEAGFVTLGSVVTKSVRAREWVTGNFAIPHTKFLLNLKKILSG